MENLTIPRLCGGTFFTLLLQAKKQRTSARQKVLGKKDGLSNKDVFLELLRIVNPNFKEPAGNSFSTYTSEYKACRLSANEYLPFDKVPIIASFNDAVINNYISVLKAMSELLETYIDIDVKSHWLTLALLELLEKDVSIDDDALFYVSADGCAVSKSVVCSSDEISFQSLILGIWHYIIMERPDNSVGQDTYNSWHLQASSEKGQRKFISQIGCQANKKISVNISDFFVNKEKNGVVPIIFDDDIAPELTEDGILYVSREFLKPHGEFTDYLENAKAKYSKIKTLLYNDQPRNFYDFYVCNDIYQMIYVSKYTYRRKYISNASAELLAECSNFVIISGTGGLGKSMMMRHLLLDSIAKYDSAGQIPIFIPLKDYTTEYGNLSEYIYEKFDALGADKTIEAFNELLLQGRFLLLFDGLDEINTEFRKQFELDLDLFTDRYPKNMFVISSRPTGSFVSFNRFSVLHLNPFTREQALTLIDRLDFRPDEPDIKAKFRTELETKLYMSHHEFTQNPLLLTIMLMTYEQFAEVPSKMHVFYREAYIALSQKHDASKGAYKRALKTGITADRFSDYFAEFCARTYRDEKYEFTELEFEKYYKLMKEPTKDSNFASASDFIHDLTANMCLMYYENHKYHFTHRSFQEYFCALYFSKQKDRTLQAIGNFFENKRSRNYGDKTFNMLYDMIPEKIDEYIFTPYLTVFFQKCDTENGYWTFLKELYPTIYYEKGDINEFSCNDPSSFIYEFIISTKHLKEYIESSLFPYEEDFITAEFVELDDAYEDPDGEVINGAINKDDIPIGYENEFGEPDVVGATFEFSISDILARRMQYSEFYSILCQDDFPLKEEYRNVREYYEELLESQQTESEDLFDLF